MARGSRGTRRESSNQGDGNRDASTVRQTIVETLEAPRLTGITTECFARFREERAIYERRVLEKNAQEGVHVEVTSYRNSIDESVLALMIRANWVDASDVEQLSEEQLQACVLERSRVDPMHYDLAQLERGIENVKLKV